MAARPRFMQAGRARPLRNTDYSLTLVTIQWHLGNSPLGRIGFFGISFETVKYHTLWTATSHHTSASTYPYVCHLILHM